MYLLDTNAWVRYLHKRPSPIKDRVRAAGPEHLRLSTIVMAELYYGAYHSPRPEENLSLLAKVSSTIAPIAFDAAAAEYAGQIRATLAAAGTPIGPNDLLIAATALANRMVVVTHNTREFSRVPGLVIEDWEVESG